MPCVDLIYPSPLSLYRTCMCLLSSVKKRKGPIVESLLVATITSDGGWICGHPPRSTVRSNYSSVHCWLALSPSVASADHGPSAVLVRVLFPSVPIGQCRSVPVLLFQARENSSTNSTRLRSSRKRATMYLCYTVFSFCFYTISLSAWLVVCRGTLG